MFRSPCHRQTTAKEILKRVVVGCKAHTFLCETGRTEDTQELRVNHASVIGPPSSLLRVVLFFLFFVALPTPLSDEFSGGSLNQI